MNKTNDGGPAFPTTRAEQVESRISEDRAVIETAHVTCPGMSLRDWFAGQALMGLIYGREEHTLVLAKEAFQLADAMISRRESEL